MGRIAMAGQGDRLDDPVDQYLHLAPYYLVVDTETMDYKVLDNRAFACEGCEINDGMLDAMVRQGVDTVMVGYVDPNELEALIGAGFEDQRGLGRLQHAGGGCILQ